MREATRDEIALQELKEKYPNMTMEEMLDERKKALATIRKGMLARGYKVPNGDDELLNIVRKLCQSSV
jgi:hypothetical protein